MEPARNRSEGNLSEMQLQVGKGGSTRLYAPPQRIVEVANLSSGLLPGLSGGDVTARNRAAAGCGVYGRPAAQEDDAAGGGGLGEGQERGKPEGA